MEDCGCAIGDSDWIYFSEIVNDEEGRVIAVQMDDLGATTLSPPALLSL